MFFYYFWPHLAISFPGKKAGTVQRLVTSREVVG